MARELIRLIIAGLVFISLTLLPSPTPAIDTLNPLELHHRSYSPNNQAIISVIIPGHPDNRQACVEVDTEQYYSSSCWLVDENSPVEFVKVFKGMPRGEYSALGILTRVNQTFRARIQFLVN